MGNRAKFEFVNEFYPVNFGGEFKYVIDFFVVFLLRHCTTIPPQEKDESFGF
jgi:hypothetical protein